MLKHWQSHAEYQQFISDTVSHLNESQRKNSILILIQSQNSLH